MAPVMIRDVLITDIEIDRLKKPEPRCYFELDRVVSELDGEEQMCKPLRVVVAGKSRMRRIVEFVGVARAFTAGSRQGRFRFPFTLRQHHCQKSGNLFQNAGIHHRLRHILLLLLPPEHIENQQI